MKKFIYNNSFLHTVFFTFRGRVLLTLVILSLAPLICLSYFINQGTKQSITITGENLEDEIVDYVAHLYRENIKAQALNVNQQLDNYQQSLLQLRTTLEQNFQQPANSLFDEPLELTESSGGFLWQMPSNNKSNVGVSNVHPFTEKTLQRLQITNSIDKGMRQFVDNNDSIAAVYFISQQSDWRIYPALDVEQEYRNEFLDSHIDLTQQFFYYNAPLADNPNTLDAIWTLPYTDITHRDTIFSVVTPVIVDNQQIGILAADITIEKAMHNLIDFRFEEPSSYALIVDKNQQPILQQPLAEQHYGAISQKQWQQIITAEQPLTLTVNDEKQIFISEPILLTNWTLIFAIPHQEIIERIQLVTSHQLALHEKQISHNTLLVASITLSIVLLCAITISKNVSRPVNNILKGIKQINRNNLQVSFPPQALQEFNNINLAFHSMMQQIDTLVTDYRNLNSDLENQVVERTNQLVRANVFLVEANKKLQASEEQRKLLFANIAHDAKTPITLILGYIGAIQDGLIEPDKYEEYFKRINNHLQSLNDLIKNVSELNYLDLTQQMFTFKTIDTTTFFQSLARMYAVNKHVLFIIPETLPSIKADSAYLSRAFINIIENAIKYAPSNTIITIAIKAMDTMLEIIIHDEGGEIPPHSLPLLFDRFYRVDKARNSAVKGHGLGLSIVKEIIHAHEGNIFVMSSPEYGTEFTITLPISSHSTN